MRHTIILVFVLFCTNGFAQKFEIMSEGKYEKMGKKKMIYSVYIEGFDKSDEHYQKIISFGDSLSRLAPKYNVQALYFTQKKFFFNTYQESIDKFKDKVLNEYSYYNGICVALYRKGKIQTKQPVRYMNEKRFKQ